MVASALKRRSTLSLIGPLGLMVCLVGLWATGCEAEPSSEPSSEPAEARTPSGDEARSLVLELGEAISVDWDTDHPAHPAYYDFPAWNLSDSLFLFMKHDADEPHDNEDDCYVVAGQRFRSAGSGKGKAISQAINSEKARKHGCVWSGADARRLFYMHYDPNHEFEFETRSEGVPEGSPQSGPASCLRRIDLGLSRLSPDGSSDVEVLLDSRVGDCHPGKMQMTPTYSQHSADPQYAGWVLLAPTERVGAQKAYLFDENGTKESVPEGLHVIDLEALIPKCTTDDYPDLMVFNTDATCHKSGSSLYDAYLDPTSTNSKCGFVHRVRLANRGNKYGPFIFASNSLESFILKPSVQTDGTLAWKAFQIRYQNGDPVLCAKHPAISPDGKQMVYLRKRWIEPDRTNPKWPATTGKETYISVMNLGEKSIETHSVQYTHDWNVGSGAHPAFRYPAAQFKHRQIVIDSRTENTNGTDDNGWIYLIKGSGIENRVKLVRHHANWEGKPQHTHPHPSTSNDGSMVTFGTGFFTTNATLATESSRQAGASGDPALSGTAQCCGVRVFRIAD